MALTSDSSAGTELVGQPDARPTGGMLAEVIDALAEGLAIFDDQARLVDCNDAFRRISAPIADLLAPGAGWDMLLHESCARGAITPQIRDRLHWMEARAAEDDRSIAPLEFETPVGSILEVNLRPTANGGFLVTERDLTARRRYQEGQREADMLLRQVLEACPANVVMSRIGDGHILYRSPAATELLGTGLNAHDHFASREERADFVTALLPEGRVDDMAVTGLRPDGRTFPCLVSARLIEYRGEEVVVSSTVDISKEVALRRTLAEQRERIFQAEKMSAMGELLAGVAHELNNPLSVVVGHALMLREEVTDPEITRRIEKISAAAERCGGIVKSFLAMARQQPVQLEPVDLRETLRQVAELLEQSDRTLHAAMRLDVADDLPEVQGDAQQLSQVVINLVVNAWQAIGESGVGDTIRVSVRPDPVAGVVELRVADNGPGIPEEIRGRIFDPLFTTKEAGKGTGIGLAFCHRVVTAHSGDIRLVAGAGGATFLVRLPIARPDATETDPDAGGGTRVLRGRVLVIDDEEDVADMIREMLARDGFVVDRTGSAEAALSLVRGHSYTLVLTDLNMPGMGGRGFYDTVLRDLPALAPRIGFITGDTMSSQVRDFLESSGRPYLEKPVSPSELRQLARRMLEAPGAEAGG